MFPGMSRSNVRRGTAGRRPESRPTGGGARLMVLQGFRVIFGSARRYDRYVRRASGIPGSLLWALSEVGQGEGDGISIGDVSARMALHQTTASNLVKALVKQGLVERARHPQDRRIVRLAVSAKGRRVLERAPHPHAGLLADALTRLDRRRLVSLRQDLHALVTEMRRASRKAAGETLLGE
jgi:DNA-binding MarR family transcriptional regulator